MGTRPERAPSTVIVGFEGPERQRRWTVLLRLLLAIPHFAYLTVLSFVAFFAVVLGWLAALVIGRLPRGIATFVGGVVQYVTRVAAYGFLLTDRYPPFTLHAPDYPVTVHLRPGRLNRMAVLFRVLLVVPASFVASFVNTGVFVAAVFVWLIVVIVGRMPQPLFEAEAAVLRYQTRIYAYLLLLTSEYPRGLFGDDPAPSASPAPVYTPPPTAAAGIPPPPPPPPPPPLLPERPRVTRLVLSRGGKRIVVLFLVLGVVFNVGTNVSAIVTAVRSEGATRELTDAYDELGGAVQRFNAEAQGCALSGGPPCIQAANARLADAFTRFGERLRLIAFPANALPLAERLEQDTAAIVATLRQLSTTSDPAAYQATVATYQSQGSQFDADFRALVDALP